MSGTREAFICDFIRTPIGRYGGALAKVRADDLAASQGERHILDDGAAVEGSHQLLRGQHIGTFDPGRPQIAIC